MVSSYSYDDRDKPTNILTVNGAVVLQNLTYTYDSTGSVTSIGNGTYTETYGYDQLDRLTSSTGPWGSLSYTYDSLGNRLSLNRGGSVTSYTYDSVNRISTATGMGFTWDDNGNLLTWDDGSDDWAYRYDSENRLINVKKNGVASARYTYDAGGRRVRSWDAAGTTDYLYSGLSIVDEVRGGVHERHVYAGGIHLASVSSETTEYFHVDHLGSTRLKTDASGNVIYESNYEPYGPEYGESGSEEFRYTGKQEETTGLYYFGARYYAPVTGRFTTRDSVFGDLSDPQSLNRYSYCRNNPYKYTDPDGKIIVPIIAGALVGATINTGIFMFTQIITGQEISGEGILVAAATGAISGVVSVVATPIAGTLIKYAGGTASSIYAKGVSIGIQALGEVGAYAVETMITGDEFNCEEATERVVFSSAFNIIGGATNILPEPIGMKTLKQSKYFSPRKSQVYINGLINPDRAANAAAIMSAAAIETLVTSAYQSVQNIITSQISAWDYIEGRRH